MKRFLPLLALLCLSFSLSAQYGNGRYTFVFLNTNPNKAEITKAAIDSLQNGHMNNINRLVKERKMIAAGPFYSGGGIFIFDTNLEDTQAILNSDPAIAANRYILEVFSTDVIPHNESDKALCTLWDKNEADIEMATNYYFVRYLPNKEDENIAAVKTNRFTEELMRSVSRKYGPDAIIAALNLNNNEGQLIFYKSDKEGGMESEFGDHTLVKSGLMTYYHKQIYFPKGVFCEK
uniref:YciI family protein n=1 Tax=Roseivirga sp. TaxID=1964215 RepID=UPI004047E88B